jgi:hypothetical protein
VTASTDSGAYSRSLQPVQPAIIQRRPFIRFTLGDPEYLFMSADYQRAQDFIRSLDPET